jgi:hypothetical protein
MVIHSTHSQFSGVEIGAGFGRGGFIAKSAFQFP